MTKEPAEYPKHAIFARRVCGSDLIRAMAQLFSLSVSVHSQGIDQLRQPRA